MICQLTPEKLIIILATYCNVINSLDQESINPAIPNFNYDHVGPVAALSKDIVLAIPQSNTSSLLEFKCNVTSNNSTGTRSSESETNKEAEPAAKSDTNLKITLSDENVINNSAAVINGSKKPEELQRNQSLASVKEIKNESRSNLTNYTDSKIEIRKNNEVEDKSIKRLNNASTCKLNCHSLFDRITSKNKNRNSHLFSSPLESRSNPRHSRSAGKRVKMLAPDENKYLESEMDDEGNITKKYERIANLLDLVIDAVGPDERTELGLLRKSKLSDSNFIQNNNDDKIEKTITQMVGFVKESLRDQMNKHSMPLPMELHSFLIWLLHGSEGSEWFPPTVQDNRSKTYYLFHENSHEPHLSRKSPANLEATIEPPLDSHYSKVRFTDRSGDEMINRIPLKNHIDNDKSNMNPQKIGNMSHNISYKFIPDKLPNQVVEQNVSDSLALINCPFQFTSKLCQGYNYQNSQKLPQNKLVTETSPKKKILSSEEKTAFDGESELQYLNGLLKDSQNIISPKNNKLPEKTIFKRDLNRRKNKGHRNKEMKEKSRDVQIVNDKKNEAALLNVNEKENCNDPSVEEISDVRNEIQQDRKNEITLHSAAIRKGKRKCNKKQKGRNFSSCQNLSRIFGNEDENFYNINDLNLLVDYLQDLRDSKIKSYHSKMMNSAGTSKSKKDSFVIEGEKDTNIYFKKRKKNKDVKQRLYKTALGLSDTFDRDEDINKIKNKSVKKGKNKNTHSESYKPDSDEYYSWSSENEPDYYEYFDVDSKVFNRLSSEPSDTKNLGGRDSKIIKSFIEKDKIHSSNKGKQAYKNDKVNVKPQRALVDKESAISTSTESLFKLCTKYVTKKVIANMQSKKGSKLAHPSVDELDKDYESEEYDSNDDSEIEQGSFKTQERIPDRIHSNAVKKSSLKHYLAKMKRNRNDLEQSNVANDNEVASKGDLYQNINEGDDYAEYEDDDETESDDEDLADDNDKHVLGSDSETVHFYVFKRPANDDDSFHLITNKLSPLKKNSYFKDDSKYRNENQRNYTKERLDSLCDVLSVLQKIPVIEDDTEAALEGESGTKRNLTLSEIPLSTTLSANVQPSRQLQPSSTELNTVITTQINKVMKQSVTTNPP